MALCRHRLNIRSTGSNTSSNSSSITISRSARLSGPSRWTISARKWSSSRAAECSETMSETAAVTTINHPHHRRWASGVHRTTDWADRATIINRSRNTKTSSDILSITCLRLTRVITIIIRSGEDLRRWIGIESHKISCGLLSSQFFARFNIPHENLKPPQMPSQNFQKLFAALNRIKTASKDLPIESRRLELLNKCVCYEKLTLRNEFKFRNDSPPLRKEWKLRIGIWNAKKLFLILRKTKPARNLLLLFGRILRHGRVRQFSDHF